MLSWMAWTWPTAILLASIFLAIGIVITIEIKKPGTSERHGVLGLTTTRGDRLFLSLLGSTYIFLAWLAFFGTPLWIPLGISIAWGFFCFLKV